MQKIKTRLTCFALIFCLFLILSNCFFNVLKAEKIDEFNYSREIDLSEIDFSSLYNYSLREAYLENLENNPEKIPNSNFLEIDPTTLPEPLLEIYFEILEDNPEIISKSGFDKIKATTLSEPLLEKYFEVYKAQPPIELGPEGIEEDERGGSQTIDDSSPKKNDLFGEDFWEAYFSIGNFLLLILLVGILALIIGSYFQGKHDSGASSGTKAFTKTIDDFFLGVIFPLIRFLFKYINVGFKKFYNNFLKENIEEAQKTQKIKNQLNAEYERKKHINITTKKIIDDLKKRLENGEITPEEFEEEEEAIKDKAYQLYDESEI